MSDIKTGWHKLTYHERGERITELQAQLKTKDELAIIVNVDLDEAVLRAEVAEAQLETLKNYAKHKHNCAYHNSDLHKCSCGLQTAIGEKEDG